LDGNISLRFCQNPTKPKPINLAIRPIFHIYDSQDSVRLISAIIKEMQLDKDIYKPKQVFSRISSYKNSLITVKAYFNNPELQEADAMSKKPRLGDIYANIM
jgi:DNA helicase-2/ATP-dependent DNA helicase PcrA